MWFLRRRCLAASWRVGAALAFVAAFFAFVRLLPWWARADVAISSMMPLVAAAFATVTEVIAVTLTPVAFGLAVVAADQSGELRTVRCLGVSPVQLARAVVPLAAAVAIACAALLAFSPPPARSLGRLVTDLVQSTRAVCADPGRERSTVPVLGHTWLCREPEPVLVGRLHERLWFATTDVEISSGTLRLRRAHFRAAGPGDTSGVRIDADVAVVPLEDAPRTGESALRGVTPALSGLGGGLVAVVLLAGASVRRVSTALLLLLPGPLLYLGTIHLAGGLDRGLDHGVALLAVAVSWLTPCSTVLLYRRLVSPGWPRTPFVGSSRPL